MKGLEISRGYYEEYGKPMLEGEFAEMDGWNAESDAAMLLQHFNDFEKECLRLIDVKLPLPAYDYCLKCSHTFNLLDARGAISITERAGYIARVRTLASGVAHLYAEQREAMGYPMLKKG